MGAALCVHEWWGMEPEGSYGQPQCPVIRGGGWGCRATSGDACRRVRCCGAANAWRQAGGACALVGCHTSHVMQLGEPA
jgi:hypothetical protein